MEAVYEGEFDSLKDVIYAFDIHGKAVETLKASEVAYAGYDCDNYSGVAVVLYRHNGTWWEVNGDHCSCHGLEGQWTPEETLLEAVAQRHWELPRLREVLARLLDEEANHA